MKPILFLAPLSDSLSCSQRLFHWLFASASGAIIGIIALALVFDALVVVQPNWYRELTKWANQPQLPIVKKCTFTPLSNDRFQESTAVASLKRYSVTFEIDTTIANSAYGIAIADFRFTLYPETDHNEIPKKTDRNYTVLQPRDYKETPLTITAIFTTNFGDLKQKTYESHDCPIRLYFFGEGE